jgi:predicted acylesterase/phospholipase RssA
MNIPAIPPRTLLFSGGGVRVLAFLGVLEVLEANNLLKQIQECAGISAGALVALMLSLNYSMTFLRRFCAEFDFNSLGSFEPEYLLSFLETYGIDDGEKIERLIESLLHHKGFEPTATFGELAASGKCRKLVVWASDLQAMRHIEFSAEKTPDISVVFAVRSSMAFPLFFTPTRHPETGHLLSDGGVFDNYALLSLEEEKHPYTLGIAFEYSKLPIEIPTIGAYIGSIFSGYYAPSYRKLLDAHRHQTIILPCQEFPALQYNTTQEERAMLIEVGRKSATEFFKKPVCSVKRRHSVA